MDIFLIIVSALCLIVAFIGSIVPILPGPPLAFVGMLILQATDKVQFSTMLLCGWLVVILIAQVLDYLIPIWTTRFCGGSKWGTRGCVAGTLVGMFLFPPWGIIIGPFLGAFLGEIMGGNDTVYACKSGLGAFLGFITGTLFKLAICIYFTFYFISALV
ncbi:DUF456 domain-containing protein [Coprobacter secundus]|jgi:hypothetical protein|uniref:DUF456 domain-containing protein n=1 Tax=Coprobacter secundus TaxID=1501392 RepID=UPI0005744670|nr:DUF456 domain-containing protein [Coprobacter secundus]KHM45768.1 membrane protein [Coprobacter secundus]